jgi:hypothetical protein
LGKQKEDKNKVVELIGKLGLEDFDLDNFENWTRFARLKSKAGTNKPGLMLVSCEVISTKTEILKSAKKLRDMDGCQGIYINCDLTNNQLDLEKN